MRQIDADALKSKILYEDVDNVGAETWSELLDRVVYLIDNAPTVDLWQMRQEATENALKKAEVLYGRPKGEWKTNLTTGDIFCSCCKEVRRDTRIKHINFCNSCGADMRKEINNGKS